MDYVDVCPPSVVLRLQEADLKRSEESELLMWIEAEGDQTCLLAATEAVAARITPQTAAPVFDSFCAMVANYGPEWEEAQKEAFRAAFLRYPYDPDLALNFYAALRATGIDIRAELAQVVRPDWSFRQPRSPGDTWDYHLYLASLDTPGALQALADKIAATRDGNDVTLMLYSLADLPGPGVTEILKRYADDSRTEDGVEGPGLPISETVAELLAERAE